MGLSRYTFGRVSEAAVMLSLTGQKLFHLHFNDNYRSWDDDMIPVDRDPA